MKKAFIWCDNASKTNFISTILKEPDRISFRDYVVKYKPKLSIVHSESHFENIRFDEHNNELQIQSNDIPVGVALFAVSATFSLIGSAIGAGVGYYLMKRHCEDLLDQFELLFIQNADRVSNSLIFGINYLKNMAEYYKKQGI